MHGENLIEVYWDQGDDTGNSGYWVANARDDEIASPRQRTGDDLPALLLWASNVARGDSGPLLRALELRGVKLYTCPTCGRPQHPGEKCKPGHADDDT